MPRMAADRLRLLDDPQLRPFLPLLYIAWADGDLAFAQRTAIAAHLAQQPWLRPAARLAIDAWLTPADPPSPRELAALRDTLRAAAATMAPEQRRSLVELGQTLAALQTHGGGWANRLAPQVDPVGLCHPAGWRPHRLGTGRG